MQLPESTDFTDWLRRVFDHPVSYPAWHWADDADTSEPTPSDCVKCLTRLFEEPEIASATYSDAQINQGLNFLVSHSCSNYAYCFIGSSVDWHPRQRGIRAIGTLFEKLFARKCSDHLLHLDEPGANTLNSICYMWWDIFPACGHPASPSEIEAYDELLAVMQRILALDSLACQESALHGLGHWQMYYPEVVRPAIEDFLARAEMRQELRAYAEHAWHGYVQ